MAKLGQGGAIQTKILEQIYLGLLIHRAAEAGVSSTKHYKAVFFHSGSHMSLAVASGGGSR